MRASKLWMMAVTVGCALCAVPALAQTRATCEAYMATDPSPIGIPTVSGPGVAQRRVGALVGAALNSPLIRPRSDLTSASEPIHVPRSYMNFSNLRIATKLWAAVGLIVLALMMLVGWAALRTARLQTESETTLAQLGAKVATANRWSALTEINAQRVLAVMTSSESAVEAVFHEPIAHYGATLWSRSPPPLSAPLFPAAPRGCRPTWLAVSCRRPSHPYMQTMSVTGEEVTQMEKIAASQKAVIALQERAAKMKADGFSFEAERVVRTEYMPASAAFLATLRSLVELENRAEAAYRQEVKKARQVTVNLAIGLVTLVLGCILTGALWLIRSIRQPLAQANELAARIAQGDLSATVDVARGDEFGDLIRSLSSMNENLGRIVLQVHQSTNSIASASMEIASGNGDLATRTDQASNSLQATASSMDTLTNTVQHSAYSARQASTLASNASSVAEKGGDVMRQVVATMQEINASSKKIADIISVIDGIAFQTNILALNAAVEAARAGEQGRGFAVVASEVRSLAQRSAEAAKEIKALIGASVERVESGSRLVKDAGSTMTEIVSSVQRVGDIIGEISAASAEQSQGINEVNQAIGQLDQMTQQNAALVEQSAAAAQSMSDQSQKLAQAVAVFKLGQSVPAGAPAAAPRPNRATLAPPQRRVAPPKLRALADAAPSRVALPAAASTQSSASGPHEQRRGESEDWESF